VPPVLWARIPEGFRAPGEPSALEQKAKSKGPNHSYNPTFSKEARRKESVREMDNVIKMDNVIEVGSTEGGCGK
jgi:hypothetical protein